MAAGLGTRLRPFTDEVPKPFLPLMDVPLAQFSLDLLTRAGVRLVVVNIHHQPAAASRAIWALDRGHTRIEISDESKVLLGSAGGIRKALPNFGDKPFFLLNADVLVDVNLPALAARHFQLKELFGVTVTLSVFPSGPKPGQYSEVSVDYKKGLVKGLGAKVTEKPFFVGAAVVEPEAIRDLSSNEPGDFVTNVLKPAIKEKKVGAYLANGLWYDVGAPELWFTAHKNLMQGLENGTLPSSWKWRLLSSNRRVGKNIWVSKKAPLVLDITNWQEGCYWSPGRLQDAVPPVILGPDCILYGSSPEPRQNGIGFGSTWFSVSKT